MFIVITGLDGSGTSTIAKSLNNLDNGSYLLKTPSSEYADREIIDRDVRKESKVGHMLYYLSSTVYMSDFIKNNCDYINKNVYLVRYLIDTVVSNRVAGIDINLNYNIYGNQLLIPDLTLFVGLSEEIRSKRIANRGKSELDMVLDDNQKRLMFLEEFRNLLDPETTIYVNNDQKDYELTARNTYDVIRKRILKK